FAADRRESHATRWVNAPENHVKESFVRLEPCAQPRPSTLGGLELGLIPACEAEVLVDRESGDFLEVGADRGEAELGVLLPVPVRAERREASIAGFACRERRGPLPHTRLERLPLVFERVVQFLHFARRNILRPLEQVAVLVGAAVALAHLVEQRLPDVRGRYAARGETQAAQLPAQQVMQWLHGMW